MALQTLAQRSPSMTPGAGGSLTSEGVPQTGVLPCCAGQDLQWTSRASHATLILQWTSRASHATLIIHCTSSQRARNNATLPGAKNCELLGMIDGIGEPGTDCVHPTAAYPRSLIFKLEVGVRARAAAQRELRHGSPARRAAPSGLGALDYIFRLHNVRASLNRGGRAVGSGGCARERIEENSRGITSPIELQLSRHPVRSAIF
jgi:hypothetical protein